MTAPAVITGETPTNDAMPTSPTPTVPAVVHELPMLSEITAQMHAVVR